MTDYVNEESVTKLNTHLNKSMVLMEGVMDTTPRNKSTKSITINTKIQPSSARKSHTVKLRKSILKTSDNSLKSIDNEAIQLSPNFMDTNNAPPRLSFTSRPHNLQELVQKEILDTESSSSAFSLDDLSDSEDVWIMDIPRAIDPQELHGQTIILGDKSKIKVKAERYCAIAHNTNCNVTCVFNIGRESSQYKTVNLKPAGSLIVRRKFSGSLKMKPPMDLHNPYVPFPSNLKRRHFLFGVSNDNKLRRKSKKHRLLKES